MGARTEECGRAGSCAPAATGANIVAAPPWVLKPRGAPDPGTLPLRLLCFPQAGAGAQLYHAWCAPLAERLGVEVCPIELPGRNSRMREPKPTRMRALVAAAVGGLAPLLESMGAWVAWEFAQEAAARGLPLPIRLFASACRAPQLAAEDPDGGRVMHELGFDAFWTAMEERYGRNPHVEAEPVRRFMWPLLRADFEVLETYEPRLAPLPMPITALGGRSDVRYSAAQVAAWAERSTARADGSTSVFGGCSGDGNGDSRDFVMLDGGHSFVDEQRDAVLAVVCDRLQRHRRELGVLTE